eukprot:TRINITY_DN12415_c2_g1_i2.p1 TRINITY_DN12415_c2_g1~~TRINITY_DN12415_c2_g1_i2.p1  ORF type:complete len:479 (+),score=99.63 TRINITY_DN12415_c2_g1_i2:124-1560(+)
MALNRMAVVFGLLIGVCSQHTPSYIVLIDAGSTGSRCHVFKSPTSTPLRLVDVAQDDSSCMISPGLAHHHSYTDVRGHLDPLLQCARSHVPSNLWGSTSVYLLATAGMRELSAEQEEDIIRLVNTVLSSSLFVYAPSQIDVIPGIVEAMFGWIGVNHNTILDNQPTLGSVDLGGASLELAYEMSASQPSTGPHQVTVTVADRHFHLYARSFRHAGSNDFRLRRLQLLHADNSSDPCLAQGAVYNITLDGRVQSFTGSSDHDACRASVTAALAVTQPCPADQSMHCSLYNTTITHVPSQRAFAVESGFYFTVQDFGLSTPLKADDVLDKAKALCKLSDQGLRQQYPQANEEYRQHACDRLLLLHSVLFSAFGLSSTNSIAPSQDGWAKGAALYLRGLADIHGTSPATTLLPSSPARKHGSEDAGVIAGVGVACFLLGVFAAIMMRPLRTGLARTTRRPRTTIAQSGAHVQLLQDHDNEL